MLLIVIGEIALVVPDRRVIIVLNESKEDASYGLKTETSTDNLEGLEYYLWSGSCYSVFTIPINTVLIGIGLRLIFCKLHPELLKSFLVILLLGTYLSTILGMIGYMLSTQESEYFKQQFFL
jgi:hypothetical protein